MRFALLLSVCLMAWTALAADAPATQAGRASGPVTFNTNFESGSIGRIEVVSPTTFRLHVAGQWDERGHNRQASWYCVRIDHGWGQELTITLTDFVGEYDDKPGAVAMGPTILPVVSEDGRRWRRLEAGEWDEGKKELTIHLTPGAESVYLAHITPYTTEDLGRLLGEVGRASCARIEVIGKTVRGREIPMVTVTDFAVPDEGKKVVWLQARQHAWEAGTSWVMEGALRYVVSAEAADLRRGTVFCFTPMVDLDGVAAGGVRFNANGYDVNRHWPQMDLRDPTLLKLMPEIWYTKKAIVSRAAQGRGIDLLLNLHNTETNEYMETEATDEQSIGTVKRLFDGLTARTSFDPSKELVLRKTPSATTTSLYPQFKIPAVLMEQRIGVGKKLGRAATGEDRVRFGAELVKGMGDAVRGG